MAAFLFLLLLQPSSTYLYSRILNQMQMKAQPWLPIFTSTLLLYLIGSSFSSSNMKVVASQFTDDFNIEEATILDFQHAFTVKKLTSRQLVDYYLHKIETLNPLLRSVIEVNPDAKDQADEADRIRDKQCGENDGSPLLGIPVLLKDSINTADEMNTTGGSYALLGSKVARDAGVVDKLRKAGAVILGKASMSEWYGLRDFSIPDGWCARSGQGVNPYVEGGNPCGSSSGSAISVAANMAAVSLGTETDGSIICPADYNSVVGFKPTVGLTSRAGVIPISPRQDTIGPICRTVSDAVYVLDSIVGFDPEDYDATNEATKFIPVGGYKQFLNVNGLKGKKLGVVRDPFLTLSKFSSPEIRVLERHLHTLRQGGAVVMDDLKIFNIDDILDPMKSGESIAMVAEFKVMLNQYLQGLSSSPVNSLADIIEFNRNNSDLERVGPNLEGQQILVVSEMTNGIGTEEKQAIKLMENLSKEGFEKLMVENDLDAMVTIGWQASTVLAIGGYPAITVPAGYQENGMPFGLLFAGLKGKEPILIETAYAFEQATMIRRPPSVSKSAV